MPKDSKEKKQVLETEEEEEEEKKKKIETRKRKRKRITFAYSNPIVCQSSNSLNRSVLFLKLIL